MLWDVALQAQLAIVAAELCQLLALHRRQARVALGPVRLRPLDSLGERRGRQIEVAGDGADGLAFIHDEPNRAGLELVREPPTEASGGLAAFHAGHRIHLSEDVHETGASSPTHF